MGESKDDKPDEKTVDQLVGALGLPELILGSLALYALRRHMDPTGLMREFPSTGYEWVDVALLGCAAALVGKVLTLASWVGIAGVYWIVDKTDFLEYRSKILAGLNLYRRSLNLNALSPKTTGLRDSAIAFVAIEKPDWAKTLRNTERSALLAYGAVLVSVLYVAPIWSAGNGRVALLLLVLLCPATLVFGILHQLDIVRETGIAIAALAAKAPQAVPNGAQI